MKAIQIDFVIPWVDGNDPAWLAEKKRHVPSTPCDARPQRYRDWGLLRYWFRGVERFAPWVRHIYFVTWGHIPDWLDTAHPKLRIVRHADYIPAEFLPTFNANPIELNLHRIQGLAEHFVYFNDDMFLLRPVREADFFVNGQPRATLTMTALRPREDEIFGIEGMNSRVLNRHFNKYAFQRAHAAKLFSWRNTWQQHIHNLTMLPYTYFSSFLNSHLPASLTKTLYADVWKAEPALLSQTSAHKFRAREDVNQWLLQYWGILQGDWVPRSASFGRCYELEDEFEACVNAILQQKKQTICCNDTGTETHTFKGKKEKLIQAFGSVFSKKSTFERTVPVYDSL